ncbi:glycoside hydrolase [Crepidotus variabilis]|uniref:lytic cellulose monooxygenase (C4-dehydrogenating) n=1 Tax=Crepidotus variabilis TaxID=179855 RepID=A0A9P6E4B4_9AGAR|nr:glycoside hydrolase [Crepidotus variabilis]
MFNKVLLAIFSLTTLVSAHYTFPSLIAGGSTQGQWVNVRRTNNYQSNGPVTDVSSADFRCYNTQTAAKATTYNVTAGSTIGIAPGGAVSHPGVLNIYMAKAPSGVDVANWDGAGQVWFKVYQISAVTNGGQSITWPSNGATSYTWKLPQSLPSGGYLVRTEHIALHSASGFQGAQFYISCAQINISGGGSGNPGPLVSIPGVYTGREPGIMLNIYYPIPTTYTQPGPAVWSG